ncbi:MAG: hypothetical protein WC213_00255 [Arenimonas sp.]
MSLKTWLRICVFLTIPSLAFSASSLIVIGGVLTETKAQVVSERERIDKLSDLMIATSREMRRSHEERNEDLALRISVMSRTVSARIDNAETNLDRITQRMKRIEASAAARRR